MDLTCSCNCLQQSAGVIIVQLHRVKWRQSKSTKRANWLHAKYIDRSCSTAAHAQCDFRATIDFRAAHHVTLMTSLTRVDDVSSFVCTCCFNDREKSPLSLSRQHATASQHYFHVSATVVCLRNDLLYCVGCMGCITLLTHSIHTVAVWSAFFTLSFFAIFQSMLE